MAGHRGPRRRETESTVGARPTTIRAGRGPVACLRASPPPGRRGWCGRTRSGRSAAAAAAASTPPTTAGRRAHRSAVWTVKSAGVIESSSDQSSGNDTGVPGRSRGLYAAATVAPPARVASTNTLPPRSSTMNAVVAMSGSRASARAASARVAAATSSTGALIVGRRSGRRRAPPWRRWSSPHRPARCRPAPDAPDARRPPPSRSRRPAGPGRAPGAWAGRCRRPAPAWGDTRRRAGWPATAACAGRCTARSAPRGGTPRPTSRRCAPSPGVYFGTFFCMNGSRPRSTRSTVSGRSASPGRMRSATASR